jgi:hypothetical protein
MVPELSEGYASLVVAGIEDIVVAMDVSIVALAIERSFKMFESALGTWLPFLFIFLSTWWTGVLVRRAQRASA